MLLLVTSPPVVSVFFNSLFITVLWFDILLPDLQPQDTSSLTTNIQDTDGDRAQPFSDDSSDNTWTSTDLVLVSES